MRRRKFLQLLGFTAAAPAAAKALESLDQGNGLPISEDQMVDVLDQVYVDDHPKADPKLMIDQVKIEIIPFILEDKDNHSFQVLFNGHMKPVSVVGSRETIPLEVRWQMIRRLTECCKDYLYFEQCGKEEYWRHAWEYSRESVLIQIEAKVDEFLYAHYTPAVEKLENLIYEVSPVRTPWHG